VQWVQAWASAPELFLGADGPEYPAEPRPEGDFAVGAVDLIQGLLSLVVSDVVSIRSIHIR